MKTIQKIQKGFTLVELLIVIGLLGVIALIVIAAINPLEQANRARDTRFKSDGSQLIAAIDRYFAANNEFPWVTVDDLAGGTLANDDSFGFMTASREGVGICGADCDTDGVLITNLELKTEFRNRDFTSATAPVADQLMLGKAAGSSTSEYACYVPASKSTRDKAVTGGKVFTLSTGGSADGTRTVTTLCDAGYGGNAGTAVNWATTGCYVCVPE